MDVFEFLSHAWQHAPDLLQVAFLGYCFYRIIADVFF